MSGKPEEPSESGGETPAGEAASAAPVAPAEVASADVAALPSPSEAAWPADVALAGLARVNLFAGLLPVHLKRIQSLGHVEDHPTGTLLFAEGSVGDKVYLILDGKVRISRSVPGIGEEALAVLSPGDYFGEMALIDDFPRSADARVHATCRLFVIAKAELEQLLFVDRALAYELLWNFVRTLSNRLRETNDKMTFLAASSRF
jgi:CRP/FNR family cyclic AMP-dependent transcriptional regulator